MPVDVLDPIAGDPMAVSAAGRTLESIALDVANIASRLRALAAGDDSWTGAAAVSAHVRTASLPPSLDKANVSYAAAGRALGSYARTLADAQDQSTSAIAAADRASAELASAVAAHAAAAARDASATTVARTTGLLPPPLTATRYEASIDEAAADLKRAVASNDDAHEQQQQAARIAAAALQQASHVGIHNQSWFHHVTHSVGHWASTHWTQTLREVSKIGTVVSALAGAAALILAVAGVAFPPLEAAAAALETVSLVSSVAAGMADTALAATGKGSWTSVGVDALSFAPAGGGKLVTKAAPLLRESRLIKPSTIVHASNGEAAHALQASKGSGLAYPGGLGANDALGGHVLTHVGVGDDSLASRGVTEASTFTDRATAEQALADLQWANGREIRVWLAGAKAGAKFRFAATFDRPVGRVLFAGRGESVDGTTAVAVLRAQPSAPLGYYMLTGFVAP
ncbi:MAG TPA: RNase A-like domain-containing protein [Acidothermaceae bacterium]